MATAPMSACSALPKSRSLLVPSSSPFGLSSATGRHPGEDEHELRAQIPLCSFRLPALEKMTILSSNPAWRCQIQLSNVWSMLLCSFFEFQNGRMWLNGDEFWGQL